MKNQYFGDINDYKKYGLLRILSGDGKIRTAICWMLTETDISTDGQFIDHLQKPVKWRSFDPLLFDKLKRCMETLGNWDVHWVETMNIITSAVFYRELMQSEPECLFCILLRPMLTPTNTLIVCATDKSGECVSSNVIALAVIGG